METSTPIKPTLIEMEIGAKVALPKDRRKSVRTTDSDIKTDEGKVFTTWIEDDKLFVKRNK